MEADVTVELFRQGIHVAIVMVAILVIPSLVVGLLVAMFQAATQINEMGLSFFPKVIVTFITLATAGPLLLKMIVVFTEKIILNIPSIIG